MNNKSRPGGYDGRKENEMTRKYRETTEDGILFIEGTANDILRAIKALERRGFVNLFCGRPIC